LVALYLTSSASGTGKTGVAAAIGKRLVSQNKRVVYLRPSVGKTGAGNDTAVLKRFLALQQSEDLLSPVFSDESALISGLKIALARVSGGNDVAIVEGPAGQSQSVLDAASLQAKVVGVESYAGSLRGLTPYYKGLGTRLAGIVMNKIPGSRVARVKSDFQNELSGIKLLGAVPEDRSLISMNVNELAENLKGTIVSGAAKSSAVFQNIMLAAMNPDHGPEYYSIKEDKAVIVRSERPDMQLAALETPTACLILAGEQPPIQMVLRRAEANNVPIVSTKEDVKATVARIESALKEARLDDRRIAGLAALMANHLDFASFL
jgi:BioD-like phosphotransacetylase family protein